ncbi:hypothetical protein L1049_004179 [Liquidambar formosana]|uniref:Pentatricopeptide repeat-containing protein n=1 Tax=Liquidambar formosana TaxID=63359 RepID=A0AAP0RRT5_LIQFO
MVRAYVCLNLRSKALELFRNMREVGLTPEPVALAIVVAACGQLGELCVAKAFHGFVSKSGIQVDGFVSSGLLSLYGDSGGLDFAYQLLSEMLMKNIVTWNTMIHQCVKHNRLELAKQLFGSMGCTWVMEYDDPRLSRVDQYEEVLALFHEIESLGGKPNILTLSSTLSACASLGALDIGTWIHAYVEKNDMNLDGALDSSLIEM